MAINKTVTIVWKSKEYKTKITMDIIDVIEQKINLVTMIQQVRRGDVHFSHIAHVFSVILTYGGAKDASPDAVFDALFGSGDIEEEDVQKAMGEIVSTIFPEPKKKSRGNSTPAKRTPKKPAKKKR